MAPRLMYMSEVETGVGRRARGPLMRVDATARASDLSLPQESCAPANLVNFAFEFKQVPLAHL